MHSINAEKPKIWVQDIVTKINKTKIGQFLFGSETLKSEEGLAETSKSSPSNLMVRQRFRVLLDRFLICLYLFVYFIMFKKLMPEEFKPWNVVWYFNDNANIYSEFIEQTFQSEFKIQPNQSCFLEHFFLFYVHCLSLI